ncbi:MAG: sensory box histidine kinase/response regulator [Candidatus Ozemobacter sibiricus]|uniref:Sensory/regulatory protein RpfC n=1 Tax=Candidatus Ozemobacter sibiricus TaxID=2268124 RepID=A0A367ZSB4_9BACT|nr:MAG: sensory box histidine kinase/response regulator [Candidatus Ozemobacter sibiricus]
MLADAGAPAPQTASPFWAETVGTRLGVEGAGASGYIAAMNLVEALKNLFASGNPALQFFQTMMAESPVWMSLFAPDGRLVSINRAGLRVIGRLESDVLGLNLKELFPHAEIPDFRSLFPPGQAVGRVTFPMTIAAGNGKERHFEVFLSPIGEPEEGGFPPGYIGLFHDVTQFQRHQEALQRTLSDRLGTSSVLIAGAEQRFRAVVEGSPHWISLVALTGEVLTINPAGLAVLETQEEAVVGLPLWSLFPAEAAPPLQAGFARLAETGRLALELPLVAPSGRAYTFDAVFTVLPEARDGEPRRCVGILNDVTQRRRAEEILRRSHDQLEEAVRARTLELARANAALQEEVAARRRFEEELRQAKEAAERAREAAERANRAKSEFLANISHEIRTPMNSVLGFTALLLRSDLNPKQREYAETVQGSGKLLLSLLDDLLDLSKIEAGKLTLEEEPFDLAAALDEVVALFRPKAVEKGLELRLTYDPVAPGPVVGDPIRVRQIFMNLIGNAVKFTNRGRISVIAKFLPDDTGRGLLRASVEDTGIGIPADKIDSLFQKFTQADASTTRKFGGTGLGLAITKQLVEKMGGSIGVWSTPDVGSNFFFFVPLRLARAETVAPTVVESASPAPTASPLASTDPPAINGDPASPADEAPSAVSPADRAPVDRAPVDRAPVSPWEDGPPRLEVLVVEDDPGAQKLMVGCMEGFPVRATVVGNGWAGVEACRQQRFDLILMDIHLPELDGLSAARAIRAMGGWQAEVPIIAVTAMAMMGDRERCLAAGMNDYLAKPMDPETFRHLLRRHLDPDVRGPSGFEDDVS